MKILYYIPFPVVGGGETHVQYLIKNGPSLEHIVVYHYAEVGPFVKGLGVPNCRAHVPAELADVITSTKPDIVHFFHSRMMYQTLKRLPRRPKTYEVVHNRLGFDGDCFGYAKSCTDYMVCVSEDAKAYCSSRLPNFPTIVIPNGVDTDVFKPTPRETKNEIPLGGYAGRLEGGQAKGIPELIEVIKDLPCRFELVGKDYGGFAKRIRERGITNIRVLPYTDRVHECYARWDFFASRSPAEGFGLSIAEAICSGLPSVVYNCGGICSQLTHGKHAFVANTDQEFRDYLLKVIQGSAPLDPGSTDLSAKTMAARYHEFYELLLKRGAV